MLRTKKIFVMVVSAVVALVMLGCGDVDVTVTKSEAYIRNTDVKGESTNCAVVLQAQQGKSYTMTIESEGDWAHFSGNADTVEAQMESNSKVVYIYFEKNNTDADRAANIEVNFSDGASFSLSFTQRFINTAETLTHLWPELPLYKEGENYIYNTYYGRMGMRSNARNYTYCFDPQNRAALWVAYPLHSCYTSGSGDRDNSRFGYDPAVDTKYQANLSRSYSGRYDRGHQIPAADRKCSQEMMDQTFYSTNMTPQWADFNQKKWGALEGKVRNMICNDTLYVVTGAYFGGEHHSSIASQTTDASGNVCPTPTYYFKALLRTKKGNTGKSIADITDPMAVRAIAFWMQHANTGTNTTISASDCISIAELEEITGFTFFPMLDDTIEQTVKQTKVPSEWGIN